MGLLNVLRSGVAIIDKVTKDLQGQVQHHTWIAQDGDGSPEYTDRIMRPAIVEKVTRAFRSINGETVMSRHRLTFTYPIPPNGEPGRNEPIDERDKFVLPDGDSKGIVLAVEQFIDRETGRGLVTQVWLS